MGSEQQGKHSRAAVWQLLLIPAPLLAAAEDPVNTMCVTDRVNSFPELCRAATQFRHTKYNCGAAGLLCGCKHPAGNECVSLLLHSTRRG